MPQLDLWRQLTHRRPLANGTALHLPLLRPNLRRDGRHAALWPEASGLFCRVHTTLAGTPARAADLTDQVWSVDELLRYRLRRE